MADMIVRSNTKVLPVLPGDEFIVTGTLRNGRRFKSMRYSNPRMAFSINVWRGSVWLLRDGKRTLLRQMWN